MQQPESSEVSHDISNGIHRNESAPPKAEEPDSSGGSFWMRDWIIEETARKPDKASINLVEGVSSGRQDIRRDCKMRHYTDSLSITTR